MSTDTTPLSPSDKPDPAKDGIDHINCYSKAQTALGQQLSNFSHVPFDHPEFGFFASLEAYWYWLKTGMQHNSLRRLYGATAKSAGIRQLEVRMDVEEFHRLFSDGIRLRIAQNPKLRAAVRQSTLPFRHYYVYGTNPPVVRDQTRMYWQMEVMEEVRATLKRDEPIKLSDGTPAARAAIREVEANPLPEALRFPTED
ncbi:hypothetical protein LUCX_334 [Xanthomonas phage vB_XciM_LucasX]|nr:hypothetical protein LUCX_334 [Xanthomonas phage vB_XciM_LucasX]